MAVNKAGNYTKPTMRKKIFQRIKSQASHGTGAGQWSARKAQAGEQSLVNLLVKQEKDTYQKKQ
jgi:hypothetical protein